MGPACHRPNVRFVVKEMTEAPSRAGRWHGRAAGGRRVIVAVFDPAQIKSVFNTGTYDALNPDIRFARRHTSVMETSDALAAQTGCCCRI
jgi:hypothetical protein